MEKAQKKRKKAVRLPAEKRAVTKMKTAEKKGVRSGPEYLADLRAKAEAKFKVLEIKKKPTPAETQQLLHELRVHQIELEMQNEELRRTQLELETARANYFDLYNLAPVGYFVVSEQGFILEANLTAAVMLGSDRGALFRQPFSRFIKKDDQDIYYLNRKRLFETGSGQRMELHTVNQAGKSIWVQLDMTISGKNESAVSRSCRIVMSDIRERKQAEEVRSLLIAELEGALEKVKALSGLLPICANCKKIRDDKGYWNQVEFFIQEHSDAQFTHSLCPECKKKLYP